MSGKKGIKHTEEWKKIISEKRKKYNPGGFKKGNTIQLGKHHSSKTKLQVGKSIKFLWQKGVYNHTIKGKIKTTGGYFYERNKKHPFRSKSNYVLKHRLVMEKILGRYLKPNEVVHHINHIKTDNRPENLYLMKPGQHILYEQNVRKTYFNWIQSEINNPNTGTI